MGLAHTVIAAVVPSQRAWNENDVYGGPRVASSSDWQGHLDDVQRPLLPHSSPRESAATYGASLSTSPERSTSRYRTESSSGQNPEAAEDEEDDDEETWELEDQGLYRGSYKRIIALYTMVPVVSVLAFIFLAALPMMVWRLPEPPTSLPIYPAFFTSPLPEILVGVSFWALSHVLQAPLYFLFARFCPNETIATLLSTTVYTLVRNLIRLAGLPLLQIGHSLPTWRSEAFRRVWWMAIGCSVAQVVVAIAQGYEWIGLYRDVLVPYGHNDREQESISASAKFQLRARVDEDLDHLMALKAREEVEEVYGIPVIRIPVFVSCLQQLNSIFLSLGLTLVISSAYLRSSISYVPGMSDTPDMVHSKSNRPFFVLFPVAVVYHLALSMLHIPMVLPRIGIPAVAYIGFLGALGAFFAGLALWDALS